MKMKKLLMGVSLLGLLAFASYLDSPYSFINKSISYTASAPAAAQVIAPVDLSPSKDMPDLEEKLVKTRKLHGFIYETYREYEVYKDDNGNVTKSVPTSKTDTLQYKDYSKK